MVEVEGDAQSPLDTVLSNLEERYNISTVTRVKNAGVFGIEVDAVAAKIADGLEVDFETLKGKIGSTTIPIYRLNLTIADEVSKTSIAGVDRPMVRLLVGGGINDPIHRVLSKREIVTWLTPRLSSTVKYFDENTANVGVDLKLNSENVPSHIDIWSHLPISSKDLSTIINAILGEVSRAI